MAVLKANVPSLQDEPRRQSGEIVDTPEIREPDTAAAASSESLRAAFEGWKKSRNPSETALREFAYAVDRFIELHGDLAITQITRRHVLQFREATVYAGASVWQAARQRFQS